MAYLVHITASPRHYGAVRVLSDLDDRDAAIAEAEVAFIRSRGQGSSGAHIRKVEHVDYTPLGDAEYMPRHDLYASGVEDEQSDAGNLVVTIRRTDVLVLTLPDGTPIKVHLHDVQGKERAQLRVEAPRDVRVRAERATEVEA